MIPVRRTIRVCFRYDDARLFARLVCAVRGGDSAHCEVAHRWDGVLHDCVSSSWLDGGVRGKQIEMPAAKWRIYEGDGDPEAVRRWLIAHDGEGYGLLRMLRFAMGLRINVGGPVCSGACAAMVGLPESRLFEPRTLEAVCARFMRRIQ